MVQVLDRATKPLVGQAGQRGPGSLTRVEMLLPWASLLLDITLWVHARLRTFQMYLQDLNYHCPVLISVDHDLTVLKGWVFILNTKLRLSL